MNPRRPYASSFPLPTFGILLKTLDNATLCIPVFRSPFDNWHVKLLSPEASKDAVASDDAFRRKPTPVTRTRKPSRREDVFHEAAIGPRHAHSWSTSTCLSQPQQHCFQAPVQAYNVFRYGPGEWSSENTFSEKGECTTIRACRRS